MPFQKIYARSFHHENALPGVNPYQWPNMTIDPLTSMVSHEWDGVGLVLKMDLTKPENHPLRNGAYVVLPRPIPLHARFYTKVTFDHPNALGKWIHFDVNKKKTSAPKNVQGKSKKSGDFNRPQTDLPVEFQFFSAEPWAVALCISTKRDITDENWMSIVSCQYHRANTESGVRLNIYNALQKDQSTYLDSPLDYHRYEDIPDTSSGPQTGNENFANRRGPVFTLIHSICGIGMMSLGHYTGGGYLNIHWNDQKELSDHRLFSRNSIANPQNATTSVLGQEAFRALGVNLGTINGAGHMRVRLLDFEVWLDTGSEAVEWP